jgi:hypothetical protein
VEQWNRRSKALKSWLITKKSYWIENSWKFVRKGKWEGKHIWAGNGTKTKANMCTEKKWNQHKYREWDPASLERTSHTASELLCYLKWSDQQTYVFDNTAKNLHIYPIVSGYFTIVKIIRCENVYSGRKIILFSL